MKIKLVIISSLSGGGVEVVNTRLAEELNKDVFVITFIALVANKKDMIEKNYSYDVDYIVGKSTKLSILKYIKKLKKCNPDIILTCKFDDAHIAFLYKYLYNHDVKIVYSQHTVFSTVKGLSINSKINNILIPKLTRLNTRLDALIFVSKGVEEDYRKNFKSITKCNKVIYNPITSNKSNFIAHKIDKQKIKLVTAGRLSPEKDQFTIIKAVKKLNELKQNTTLDIFGAGDLEKKLLEYATEIGVEKKIRIKGYSNNLLDDLKLYDIFVLASLYESFGNVIVEAMNSGLPIISSDCPVGPRDILDNGKYGILIPMKNADAIVNAVIKYRDMNLDKLQLNAYNRSLKFSIEKSVESYTKLFYEILHK